MVSGASSRRNSGNGQGHQRKRKVVSSCASTITLNDLRSRGNRLHYVPDERKGLFSRLGDEGHLIGFNMARTHWNQISMNIMKTKSKGSYGDHISSDRAMTHALAQLNERHLYVESPVNRDSAPSARMISYIQSISCDRYRRFPRCEHFRATPEIRSIESVFNLCLVLAMGLIRN